MPHDVISTCPVCSGELAVTRLHCRSCGTTLEGEFSVGRFGRLTREQLAAARELPPVARQPAGHGARAQHLVPDRPLPRRGARPRARLRARADGDEAADDAPAAAGARRPTDAAAARQSILERLARHEITRRRGRRPPSEPSGGPIDDADRHPRTGTTARAQDRPARPVHPPPGVGRDHRPRRRGRHRPRPLARRAGRSPTCSTIETGDGFVELRQIEQLRPRHLRLGGARAPSSTIEVPHGANVSIETAERRHRGQRPERDEALPHGLRRGHPAAGSPAPVDVETVSGDIELDGQAPLDLVAKSVSGDVEVRVPRLRRLDLGTTSGDIRLDAELAGDGPVRAPLDQRRRDDRRRAAASASRPSRSPATCRATCRASASRCPAGRS